MHVVGNDRHWSSNRSGTEERSQREAFQTVACARARQAFGATCLREFLRSCGLPLVPSLLEAERYPDPAASLISSSAALRISHGRTPKAVLSFSSVSSRIFTLPFSIRQ
jgi:hypothetical protein